MHLLPSWPMRPGWRVEDSDGAIRSTCGQQAAEEAGRQAGRQAGRHAGEYTERSEGRIEVPVGCISEILASKPD